MRGLIFVIGGPSLLTPFLVDEVKRAGDRIQIHVTLKAGHQTFKAQIISLTLL